MVEVKLVVTSAKGTKEIRLEEQKPTKNFLKFKLGGWDDEGDAIKATAYLPLEEYK